MRRTIFYLFSRRAIPGNTLLEHAVKLFLSAVLVIIPSLYSYGQNKVEFAYDGSGNRIKREIVLAKTRSMEINGKTEPLSESIGERTINIYPNPTKGELSVSISEIGNNSEAGYVSLFDITGRMIFKSPLKSVKTDLNIESEPNGVYLMRIEIDGKSTTWKIVKE